MTRRAGSGTEASGRRTVKLVPSPTTLSTVSCPLWLAMMPCVIDRPSPVPLPSAFVV